MGRANVCAAVCGAADDDRAIDEAAAHVANLTGVVDDLVPGHVGEAPEHKLHHGTNAEHRGSHAHADEPGFTDRGVDHAFVAEALPESFGHFVGAIVTGDFLANDDDIFVAHDFLGEGVVDCFAIGYLWHGADSKKWKK